MGRLRLSIELCFDGRESFNSSGKSGERSGCTFKSMTDELSIIIPYKSCKKTLKRN